MCQKASFHYTLKVELFIPVPLQSSPNWFGTIKADAIETESEFDLAFYRELVRGNHRGEEDLTPIYRWTRTKPPIITVDRIVYTIQQAIGIGLD
ncbi:hypothetical protein CSA56_07170 [candidate division KSB3 bacterium]|uniref:Uncharacterized protein n=1 Tax=candidate division KSB3 bacterium TaxID=2044937 RepID=A0A2G6KG60_9BACT|nr:MAG: hypothetical protein CSA56_07170 [candidate division KSB3 bacterium]